MIEKKVKIINNSGIHMRPAMLITDEALKYKSDIVLIKNDIKGNAKSIMEVSMLAAQCGDELIIRTKGEDEKNALKALYKLIGDNF